MSVSDSLAPIEAKNRSTVSVRPTVVTLKENQNTWRKPVSLISMLSVKRLIIVALILSAVSVAFQSVTVPSAAQSSCVTATSGGAWQNTSFISQSGTFTAEFDVTPSTSPLNAVVGLSQGAQTAYTGLAAVVRFNPSGMIDARNGGAYAAASSIPYSGGVTYHFYLEVNVPAHTYSIFVTPEGGAEQTVGLNFAFRTEQASVTSLNSWAAFANTSNPGSLTVCDFKATTTPAPNVFTSAELTTAINNAAAGTTIVLADGTYTGPFSVTNKNGTSSSRITIRAANQGRAIISGNGGFPISGSSFITIQGLKFTNLGTAIALTNSNHVRITRNRLALATNASATKWIVLNGTASNNNQIDHNEFGPRHDLGQMISIDGSSGQVAQNTLIEFNYFHDADPQTSNGGETIRVGLSGLSMSDGFNTIQNNLFVNCDSDAEVISVKSKNNTVRYNTFRNNKGQVTARHGHNNSYYGNFFFGDGVKAGVGGFRIYGNDHRIYNNYLENLTSDAINIDGGDFDAGPDGSNFTSADLTKHWRVYRTQVTNNTVVNSKGGSVAIGRSFTFAPVDCRVANNIVKGSVGPLYNEVKTSNTVFEGNIGFGATLDNVSRTSAEIRNVDPSFTTVNNLQKLSSGSPAIGAAVGTYSYVTDDMDGQARDASKDVGADEFSSAAATRRPLTTADVGVNAP